jgi:hypothetical protein
MEHIAFFIVMAILLVMAFSFPFAKAARNSSKDEQKFKKDK